MKKTAHILLIIAIIMLFASAAFCLTLLDQTTGHGEELQLTKPLKDLTCQITLNKVADNLTVALEGSVTGLEYGELAKYDLTASDLSKKAAFFSVTGTPVKYIRGNLLWNPDNATIKMSCIGIE